MGCKMANKKIPRSVFRYIEHELYNYKELKKELEEYREEILESTSKTEGALEKNTGTGDSTANKVTKLLSSSFVVHAERTIKAIDGSLEMLRDEHRELFECQYQQRKTWQQGIIELNMSKSSYFRHRQQLVEMVGQRMGLVNIRR